MNDFDLAKGCILIILKAWKSLCKPTLLQQVQAGIKESSSVHGKAPLSEAAETSVLYVRFKAAASEVKLL